MLHDVDEVVAGDDVVGIGGSCDPSDEPDDESQDEQRDQDPADDAAALVHLSLLPVVSGGASNDASLCIRVNVHY